MPFASSLCKDCGKPAISEAVYEIGPRRIHRLKCQHLMDDNILQEKDPSTFTSLTGQKPFKFQIEGIRFGELSGVRCLFADEMGLGKTIQALGLIALHEDALCPFVGVLKASLMTQWQHQTFHWCGEEFLTQRIESASDMLIPGLKGYFITYDLLRRMSEPKGNRKSLKEQMDKLGIKLVILDECQQIKNPESARSKEVRDICKGIEHIIALSGTPIKNRASEYFSILNILKPTMFPVYSKFVYNECQSYWDGFKMQSGGLSDPAGFMEKTKRFIIRRERKEVMPDLPPITRAFNLSDLGPEVEKAYQEVFMEFRDDFNSEGDGETNSAFAKQANILAYMSKMRHLTGLSKIRPCVEFVEDFLDSTDRKLVVFVHHQDVGDILALKLAKLTKICRLEGGMDSDARQKVVTDFTSAAPDSPRVMVASTLASGEGLNLQICSDCVMLERQWNPANEEQAEGRFSRIGQLATSISATYFIAVGTIDEFFSELVERKREIVNKTLGGEAVAWDQTSLMSELAQNLATSGGRKWSI